MTVLVVGAGRMGAQIAIEHALAGVEVVLHTRTEETAWAHVDAALSVARTHTLFPDEDLSAARRRLSWVGHEPTGTFDLVVESLPEDFDLKIAVLAPIVHRSPDSVIASNTSSLSIGELGKALGRGEQTVGTHYWNPPMLMPLVEVIPGGETSDATIRLTHERLQQMGKTPVACADIPGFVWNRLQFAILREALALVDAGAVSVDAVDLIFRNGLGRRWSAIGLFESVALGGVGTFEAVATNLFPLLHVEVDPARLSAHVQIDDERRSRIAMERDRALVNALRSDRPQNPANHLEG